MSRIDLSRNSTTVRSLFSGLQVLSPGLAAELAAVAMSRTTRRRPPPFELEIRGTAEPLRIDGPHGELAALRWGQGPLALLVHGWNGRGSQLGAFVAPLVAAGYQVVAFDAPGHGDSAGSTSSMVRFADAFDAVVGATKPFFQPLSAVVAHSMGGAAVTYALSRSRERDERGLEFALGRPRLAFIAPPIDVRDFVLTVSGELGLSARTRGALETALERRVGARIEDLHAVRHAKSMTCPLLVVHDTKDRAVPIECGEELAKAWPGARFHTTNGLGHSRILRDPATIATIVDFLKGVTSG